VADAFAAVAGDLSTPPSSLTVAKLKAVCTAAGLSTTGRKADLVSRVAAALPAAAAPASDPTAGPKRKRKRSKKASPPPRAPRAKRAKRAKPNAPAVSKSQATTTVAASPAATSSSAAIAVMLTGITDSEAERMVASLGGSMATEPAGATHLITDKVRRTAKFMACLARGVPIVSDKWLDDSFRAGHALAADTYILRDRPAERKFGFKLQDSLAAAAAHNLFGGLCVYVTPRTVPPPAMLHDIIIVTGGTVCKSKAAALRSAATIVVACDADAAFAAKAASKGHTVVSSEFVLSGLLRYKLEAEAFAM